MARFDVSGNSLVKIGPTFAVVLSVVVSAALAVPPADRGRLTEG